MFFDEAYKGNPRAVGGGGVILNPEDYTEINYCWSISSDTNNIAEAHDKWQALRQLKVIGVEEALVFGDFRLII